MSSTRNGSLERKASISNIQKYNMHDGPGVRTLVFFKGCPLRCKWCANPESLKKEPQVMISSTACVDCGACVSVCPTGVHQMSAQTGKHEVNPNRTCIACYKCTESCNYSAISIVGKTWTISELLEEIQKDRMFYDMSGGGVTLGGGDPLMQPEAARNLLMACKQEGIHTAMETSGYAKLENLLAVAEFTDLFLYDIKHIDSESHYRLTGVHNEQILNNIKVLLQQRYQVRVRMPMLKGLNDSREAIQGVVEFLQPYREMKNFQGVDILPYHRLGVNKYNQLGWDYPLADHDPALSEEDLQRIAGWIKDGGISAQILRH